MQSERVWNRVFVWFEYSRYTRREYVTCALRDGNWGKDFIKFCSDNQHIIDAVVYECGKLLAAGRTRYSMRTIVEVLRHNSVIRQRNDKVFKINDHCAPDLARLMMILFPVELAGFFEVRGR